MSRERIGQLAKEQLDHLAESFHLYPQSAYAEPKPDQYAEYLYRFPQYNDPSYRLAAQVLSESRRLVEEMPQDMQELAGALIRITFTNEQLEAIGGPETLDLL